MISLETIIDTRFLEREKPELVKPKKSKITMQGNKLSSEDAKDISEQIKLASMAEVIDKELNDRNYSKKAKSNEKGFSNLYAIFESFYSSVYSAYNGVYNATSKLFSRIQDGINNAFNGIISYKELDKLNGYSDKLLNEVEDWGVIYFKTAFKNLSRITPLGAASRYLETLWIAVVRKVKV